jgi:hypothetical protein
MTYVSRRTQRIVVTITLLLPRLAPFHDEGFGTLSSSYSFSLRETQLLQNQDELQ